MIDVARFFFVRSDVEIEKAYRLFLRKTWLTPFAILSWACVAATKTGYFLDGTLTLSRHVGAGNFLGIISFVLWPSLLVVLSLTLGRHELKAVAFGNLKNIWCVALVAIPLGVLAHYAINLTIAMLGGTIKPSKDYYDFVSGLSYFIFTGLLTPIMEESWFRLVLQTYLQRFGTWSGVGLTATLFALFHIPFFDRAPMRGDLTQALVILPAGVIFGLSRRYFGSMLVVVVMHMTSIALAD